MDNNRIYAKVKWYDEKRGYGIAISENDKLFIHSSYFINGIEKVSSEEVICCTPFKKNDIYHALDIEVIKKDKVKTINIE